MSSLSRRTVPAVVLAWSVAASCLGSGSFAAAGPPTAAADGGSPKLAAAVLLPARSAPSSAPLPGTACPVFPADNVWHADVQRLAVHPRSRQWLAATGAGKRRLHPDFGPSYGEQSEPYGIPVTVVGAGHGAVGVDFDYADESDRRPYPLGDDTRIEGGRDARGDRHAIVVDATTCTLYETWDTHPGSPRWSAGSGAVWDLRSNALRPKGWTSADAAGLPILPGLLRWDEVAAGKVDHAIRFTASTTSRTFVWPARHQAGATSDKAYPPMGARFRLKKSFSLRGYSAQTKVVLRAMKRYGLILADNGSSWYFQGTADPAWPDHLIEQLKRVPAKAFEAVNTRPLKASADSGRVR
ncbi:MAG: hypothetical protein EPO13_00085 [Actinomycetota bacterium]|nr:MAG: hypothetical protein EPO13_00085 [Actinomycetota bacterium]